MIMTNTIPFGFAPVADPGQVPVPAPAPAATPDPEPYRPAVGTVVCWPEYDVYDEQTPERTRFGVIVAYDAAGAAQVLLLGDSKWLAHFGPAPTEEGPHGPTVADLKALA